MTTTLASQHYISLHFHIDYSKFAHIHIVREIGKLTIRLSEHRLILLNSRLVRLVHFYCALSIVLIKFTDAVRFECLAAPDGLQGFVGLYGLCWIQRLVFSWSDDVEIDPGKIKQGWPLIEFFNVVKPIDLPRLRIGLIRFLLDLIVGHVLRISNSYRQFDLRESLLLQLLAIIGPTVKVNLFRTIKYLIHIIQIDGLHFLANARWINKNVVSRRRL